MSKTITWYFDFIPPFAYLQQTQFPAFPDDLTIEARPVLFAGLLNHWEHKGPAEIPAKRLFTYRHTLWMANNLGIPLRMPPTHPFNPLRALRLAIEMENDLSVIAAIFNYIWQHGIDPADDAAWIRLTSDLGIEKSNELVTQPSVKQQLRLNTEEAINAGIFSVPTIKADEHLFWGFDATEMYLDYYKNPDLFDDSSMQAISTIPRAAQRKKLIHRRLHGQCAMQSISNGTTCHAKYTQRYVGGRATQEAKAEDTEGTEVFLSVPSVANMFLLFLAFHSFITHQTKPA